MPETKDLEPLIRARYTPEEATLLTGIPFRATSLEELAEAKGMEPAELGARLDVLAEKGVVYRRVWSGQVRYRLNDMLFVFMRSSFWPGGTDAATQTLASLANRYYYEFIEQWDDIERKGLRTVPINKTIEDRRSVLTYDDVSKIVDEREYWAVTHCACRHRKNADPGSPTCQHETEVCLHFDGLGRYIVTSGLGREITREETHEILRRAADAGLVHSADNWREGVQTICNCCKCCCMWFEAFHVLHHSKSVSPSSYRVRVDSAACRRCGECVKRCPMDALHLDAPPEATNAMGEAPALTRNLCIGCGVCVHKCPAGALVLVPRDEHGEPPGDVHDFVRHFRADCEKAGAHRHREEEGETGCRRL